MVTAGKVKPLVGVSSENTVLIGKEKKFFKADDRKKHKQACSGEKKQKPNSSPQRRMVSMEDVSKSVESCIGSKFCPFVGVAIL